MSITFGTPLRQRTTSTPFMLLAASLVLGACGDGIAGAEPVARIAATTLDATQPCESVSPLPSVPATARLVTEFGAIPNDDLPDDDAIAAALASLPVGGWLIFPPGRYIQSRSISVNQAGVVLWGFGAELFSTNPDDQTVGLRSDYSSIYGFTLTGTTDSRRSKPENSRISIYRESAKRGLQQGNVVRGNMIVPSFGRGSANPASGGILVYGARDFTVAENTVRRTLADGIHVTGGSRNGRVIGNVVEETGDDMIAIVSYLGHDWAANAMRDPNWLQQRQASFLVSDVLIAGNRVTGEYWGRGIAVVGGTGITIRDNEIYDSAQAAAVLVAQEGGYATFASTDVVIRSNRIRHVQTRRPNYVPDGASFADLRAKVLGPSRTGHAAIEVHAIQNEERVLQTPSLSAAIGVRNILLDSNEVTETLADGVRVGIDSANGLVSQIAIVGNRLSDIGGSGVQVLATARDSTYCAANAVVGERTIGETSRSCLARQPPYITGARLDCSRFR